MLIGEGAACAANIGCIQILEKCMGDIGPGRKRRLLWIALAIVAVVLFGWGTLRPDFRPDVKTVSPSIRNELVKTGFVSTKGIGSARFMTIESIDGYDDNWDVRQKVALIDVLFTEKRTRRDTKGLTQEVSGLYVGPIAVVRFSRNPPPIFGDLLPNHFWMSSRLSTFTVEEKIDFPHSKGGRLAAKIAYEDRLAGEESGKTEHGRLRCEVMRVVDAASIDTRLSGQAARIDCKESMDPVASSGALKALGSEVSNSYNFSNWYILDRGWSMPIESEHSMRMGETTATRKSTSKLISFDIERTSSSK